VAFASAEELGVPVLLGDRPVDVTLQRLSSALQVMEPVSMHRFNSLESMTVVLVVAAVGVVVMAVVVVVVVVAAAARVLVP
jgi:hypothetical protein